MEFDKERVGNVVVVRIRAKKLTSQEAPEMKTALLGLLIGEGEKFLLNLHTKLFEKQKNGLFLVKIGRYLTIWINGSIKTLFIINWALRIEKILIE